MWRCAGNNMLKKIEDELSKRIYINSVYYYTDSKIVLSYISNESKRFHVYTANRVHQIHNVSKPEQWCYVPTDENPADTATRGIKVSHLQSSS